MVIYRKMSSMLSLWLRESSAVPLDCDLHMLSASPVEQNEQKEVEEEEEEEKEEEEEEEEKTHLNKSVSRPHVM